MATVSEKNNTEKTLAQVVFRPTSYVHLVTGAAFAVFEYLPGFVQGLELARRIWDDLNGIWNRGNNNMGNDTAIADSNREIPHTGMEIEEHVKARENLNIELTSEPGKKKIGVNAKELEIEKDVKLNMKHIGKGGTSTMVKSQNVSAQNIEIKM